MPATVDPGTPTVFRADDAWPTLLTERLDALDRHPDDVRAVASDLRAPSAVAAGMAIARRAAIEQPERVTVDDEAVELRRLGLRVLRDGTVATTARVQDGADGSGRDGPVGAEVGARVMDVLGTRPPHLVLLEALALALQEDLVLMVPSHATDAAGRVAWLHVAFPSGWDPGAMAGASFQRLHAPVPEADALQGAASALVRAMLLKGPYVRYVWGLAPDGSRSRHPRRAARMRSDHPLGAAWLRVERQTTLPLPAAGAALFAIGVHVVPLSAALTDPVRREAFADAVASLSPAAKRYKGVPWDAEAVRRWCRALG